MCILLSSVFSFVTLRDSCHVQWGLLFTCRVVNRRVGVLTWLCWLPDRTDVAVGCSGSLVSTLCFF